MVRGCCFEFRENAGFFCLASTESLVSGNQAHIFASALSQNGIIRKTSSFPSGEAKAFLARKARAGSFGSKWKKQVTGWPSCKNQACGDKHQHVAERGRPESEITLIGIDLAKNIFRIPCRNKNGKRLADENPSGNNPVRFPGETLIKETLIFSVWTSLLALFQKEQDEESSPF